LKKKGWAMFSDAEGDLANKRNCGFSSGWFELNKTYYYQETAFGLFGALRDIKNREAKNIAFSLGGWSMSYAFSELCEDTELRKALIESIADIRKRFPMFTQIDLDWEYPGSAGNGNVFSLADGENFGGLIEELFAADPVLQISIAISASPLILESAGLTNRANVERLLKCNVHFNLMSYDLFSVTTGENLPLGHHTNLDPAAKKADTPLFSTSAAVALLINSGVTPRNIFIGFAGYSRNARNATLTSVSPLIGTYNPENLKTVGTFEHGVTELPDLLSNYLDLDGMADAVASTNGGDDVKRLAANKAQYQSTGFILCTDTESKADFLHNPGTNMFMSIETPRSVYAKAQYVAENKLGGLFIWSGDQDNGLLVNAAWEGLGVVASTLYVGGDAFDMTPYIAIEGVKTMAEYLEVRGEPKPPEPGWASPREDVCKLDRGFGARLRSSHSLRN
ncbi:MAG: hypothetical protein K2Q15_07570, partial [Burkholderiales bacterium]|nr:hypothetical protein [Burkholderiales bacterium]